MRKIILAAVLLWSMSAQAAQWEDPYLANVKDLDIATLSAMHARGDMTATVEFARRQFQGRQYAEGIRLASLAASQNIRAGHHALGMMYYLCHASCKDIPKAIAELEKGAALGHPLSHEALADFYNSDRPGMPKDQAKAFPHYLAAAEQGVGSSQLNVADMLCRGHGVDRDVAQGRKWVQRMNAEHQAGIEDEDVGCE